MLKSTKDLTGMKFGTVTVDEFTKYSPLSGEGQRRFAHFKCHCSCGNIFELSGRAIERFTSPILNHSCSCPQIEYCSMSGAKLHHLRLRYESSRIFDVSFPEFCFLSMSACFTCGDMPIYPQLNRLKKLRKSSEYVSICDKCRLELVKKWS